MTREEALKQWLPIVVMGVREMPEVKEAVKMAIKALEQEPCGYAVSRRDVEDAIAEAIVNGESLGYGVAYDILSDLPPVTPQQKMGRWVKTIGENGVTSAIRCSGCGFEDNRYELFNYCPNCGCKMQEVEG